MGPFGIAKCLHPSPTSKAFCAAMLICKRASARRVPAGDVQSALQNVGDRLTASMRPVKDAPLFNFGIGASFELDKAMVQPIVGSSIHASMVIHPCTQFLCFTRGVLLCCYVQSALCLAFLRCQGQYVLCQAVCQVCTELA